MTANQRAFPDASCIEIDAIPLVKPACGIMIVSLLWLMFSIGPEHKPDLLKERISADVIAQPVRRSSRQSSAALIPVLTGGIGSSTSLGGNSSLGGSFSR
ncbi:hypothetical protein KBI23_01355 [bacterium]|nr:hypothetical protein [bacterium]MBP9807080.1 hypothetical protein [bacterium]